MYVPYFLRSFAMATLYVKNVPDDVYAAMRKKASQHRSSVTAEVIALLRRHYPTETELKKRRNAFRQLAKLRKTKFVAHGAGAEETVRKDRER